MHTSHYQSTKKERKKQKYVFPSFFETKTGAHNTSSTNKMHLLQTSNRKQPAEERTPKNPPSEDGDRRSSHTQRLRAERGCHIGTHSPSSVVSGAQAAISMPSLVAEVLPETTYVVWFELCSWQCGLQAYFPNLRKLRAHPYSFNELARDDSYWLQLRTLMNLASIVKGLRKMTETKHSRSSKWE